MPSCYSRILSQAQNAPCACGTAAADQIAIPKYLTAGDIHRRKSNAILQQVNANYCPNGAILRPSGNGIGTAKTTVFRVPSNGNEGPKQKKTGLAMRTPSAKKSGEKA